MNVENNVLTIFKDSYDYLQMICFRILSIIQDFMAMKHFSYACVLKNWGPSNFMYLQSREKVPLKNGCSEKLPILPLPLQGVRLRAYILGS